MSRRDPHNIVTRRKEEERLKAATAYVAADRMVAEKVGFEHRSSARVVGTVAKQRIEDQMRLQRERLDDRRRRLATLLNAEREQYEQEIAACIETPEQAKARMFAYARQLKEENDAAKKKLVEQLEKRRLMQSSDVLRERASKITAEMTALDRLSQLQEKYLKQKAEEEAMRAEAASAQSYLAEEDMRKRAAAEARRRLAAEMRGTLSAQMAVHHDLEAAAREYELSIDRSLAARAAEEAEALRRREAAEVATARAEAERLKAFNLAERTVKQGALAEELHRDRADLEAALRREAAEIASERAAVEARKADILAFQAGLKEQMARQDEDKSWMDEYYNKEQEKVWAKRQAQWDADAAARAALRSEVKQVQEAQMAERARRGEIDAERDRVQLQVWHKDLEAAKAREEGRVQARRSAAAEHADLLKMQLADNASARAAEAQAAYLEWRLMKKQEEDYQRRVAQVLKETDATSAFAKSGAAAMFQ